MKTFLFFILSSFISLSAMADTISEIEIQGNERLSREAVLQYVNSKPGQELNRLKIRDDLKALYNTGLFKDIQIDVEKAPKGPKVIIKVKEKDYIQEIRFKGNKEISKDDLEKGVALKIPFLWDDALVKSSIEKVRKLYRDKSFYLVTLRTEILTENKKKVLQFEIDEGEKVEVKKVYFQGNKVFSDETLKDAMITKEGGFWSSLSGSGRFDESLLTQVDARRIQLQYWKNGYAFAKVDTPTITFTPDRRQVFVSYHIEEGDKYDVGNITFSGDLDFIPDPEVFKETLASRKGAVWNYLKIQDDLTKVQDLYGDHGYAYTNVSPDWKISETNPKVLDIEFRIDKGSIVYFGSIDVQGNAETYDRIVRRELEFKEGELYNGTRFKSSKENLEKLGYFTTVKFIQKDILAENRMDITIEVEEKQTGTLTLGASFSSFDRFGLQGSVSKTNLFGQGYDVSLSALFSSKRQLFNAMFRNPRVMDTKYSLTIQGFNTEYSSIDETRVKERGGSLTVGYPFTKKWSIAGTYGIQSVDINIQDIIKSLYPDSFGLQSSLGVSLTRDTLNAREMNLPSKGTLNQISATAASKILGSDMSFWKTSFVSKKYIQVFDEDSPFLAGSVLSLGLRLDYLRGMEGRSTPFNERFIPGGIYSIRGHLYRSLGPSIYAPFNITGRRDDDSELGVTGSRQLRLGGNKQAIFNMEYLFDIFKEAKIKGVLFFDAGNTFPESNFRWRDIRASTGFGFRWFSPLGPLRFEWGIPLDRKTDEDSILFDFSIGAPF
ncbi:MAG: outer membrane protein assembly factor YaeT precursor [Bacteriovoracaceae bacterium]|nr:outer membrane protein assembly factor YaeT precursor [Bacteriovoracaceae bacterium]